MRSLMAFSGSALRLADRGLPSTSTSRTGEVLPLADILRPRLIRATLPSFVRNRDLDEGLPDLDGAVVLRPYDFLHGGPLAGAVPDEPGEPLVEAPEDALHDRGLPRPVVVVLVAVVGADDKGDGVRRGRPGRAEQVVEDDLVLRLPEPKDVVELCRDQFHFESSSLTFLWAFLEDCHVERHLVRLHDQLALDMGPQDGEQVDRPVAEGRGGLRRLLLLGPGVLDEDVDAVPPRERGLDAGHAGLHLDELAVVALEVDPDDVAVPVLRLGLGHDLLDGVASHRAMGRNPEYSILSSFSVLVSKTKNPRLPSS